MATRLHVPLPEEVNVSVVVRVRPPLEREKQLGYSKCLSVDSLGHSLTVFQMPPPGISTDIPFKPSSPQPTPRTFTFDYVADESVTQEEIFTAVGKPMAHACLQGYHCCLIAYGQTGAGKTYTMEGPSLHTSFNDLDSIDSGITEKSGLIPRILETIFLILAAEKAQSGVDVEFSVRCSSLQIYNEQVEDLLCPNSTNLTIHEDAKIGMYVEGLQEIEVQTPEATYEVLKRGSLNRHVGATAMNAESSRSHGVFILSVESQRQDLGILNRRISRFYLVDLAGSERQKQTEAVGLRLRESGSINRSLSALGNVIKALLETTEGKIRHIPYRDSKLTYLLKDALGGNSRCTLIANVSPSIINLEETICTLKFAQRAKYIRNVAMINEDTLGNSSASAEEVKRLRLEIAALRARINSTLPGEQSMSWNDHSSNNQIRRLEYIISQSSKQALAGERKTAQEMHALSKKIDALKSLYLRVDRALQALDGGISQKERKRETSSSPAPSHSQKIYLPQGAGATLDRRTASRNVQFNDLTDEAQLSRPDFKRNPETSSKTDQHDHQMQDNTSAPLKTQIVHLKTMNKSLKQELETITKEKKSMLAEFAEVKRDRDQSKKRLASLEDQISQLQDTIQKLKKRSDNRILSDQVIVDEDDDDDDDDNKMLVNFQRKKHLNAFKSFISRPRLVEIRRRRPNLLCRLFRRKKRRSNLELMEEA